MPRVVMWMPNRRCAHALKSGHFKKLRWYLAEHAAREDTWWGVNGFDPWGT